MNSRHHRSLLRLLRLTLVFVVWITFLPMARTAPDAVQRPFNIPRGDAAVTLRLFVEQSGEQVIFLVDHVRGITTNEVQGEMSASGAIRAMLQNTELRAFHDAATGAIVIRRRNGAPANQQPESSPIPTRPVVSAAMLR